MFDAIVCFNYGRWQRIIATKPTTSNSKGSDVLAAASGNVESVIAVAVVVIARLVTEEDEEGTMVAVCGRSRSSLLVVGGLVARV